ncbi:MAG TPA: BadF/BadG/BcrA/BcrD ATPase family protein [Candidatus Limnocylindria bacterium]
MAEQPLLLGVDGGNSKTHLVLARADGTLLGAVAGPTTSHQQVPMPRAMERLASLADAAAIQAGLEPGRRPLADMAVVCSAGADLPSDLRNLRAGVAGTGLARAARVLNDGFAPLRAGSARGWGVALICGAGVNCVGMAPDGRVAAFPALGDISGDWGGGASVGMAALQAAVRARDGRGARTQLEHDVPRHFGLRRPIDVTAALYRRRLRQADLRDLAPVVFRAADGGDAVARGILDRLGDELALMAVAIIRRLRMARLDLDVVLSGGLFAAGDAPLVERVRSGVRRVAPGASVESLDVPPVLGAVLLALDANGSATPEAEARLRAQRLTLEPVTGA